MNERVTVVKNITRTGCLLILAALVTACSNDDQSTFTVSAEGDQVLELSPPEFITSRAVDLDFVFPRVSLNGTTLNLSQLSNGTTWRGQAQVPEGEAVELEVRWIETFRGRELLLAVADLDYPPITSNTNVLLLEEDYTEDDLIAFPRLDDDNDRIPNLAERNENSDPFNPLDPGTSRANAFVTAIDPADAPVIDGSFDNVWGAAQYRDRDDELLFIDNRLIGFDPDRLDGSTEYRWGSLHDGQYLYFYVLGEAAANRTAFGDSVDPWQDDSIEIYWDGNRSQGTTYDGVDDFHLIIPLLKLNEGVANRSHLPDTTPDDASDDDDRIQDPDGRAETGFNSASISDLEGVRFATCVCPGSDTYEVRLDLEALQIPVDQSFGFELQLNDDNDGGDREFKFGWRAPSAAEGVLDGDVTWENPSTMGLLELISN